jgi:hypothetical protein
VCVCVCVHSPTHFTHSRPHLILMILTATHARTHARTAQPHHTLLTLHLAYTREFMGGPTGFLWEMYNEVRAHYHCKLSCTMSATPRCYSCAMHSSQNKPCNILRLPAVRCLCRALCCSDLSMATKALSYAYHRADVTSQTMACATHHQHNAMPRHGTGSCHKSNPCKNSPISTPHKTGRRASSLLLVQPRSLLAHSHAGGTTAKTPPLTRSCR